MGGIYKIIVKIDRGVLRGQKNGVKFALIKGQNVVQTVVHWHLIIMRN